MTGNKINRLAMFKFYLISMVLPQYGCGNVNNVKSDVLTFNDKYSLRKKGLDLNLIVCCISIIKIAP